MSSLGIAAPAATLPGWAPLLNRALRGTLISIARVVTGAEARWIGCAPDGAQRIYIANHTSHADFILVWAALPPPFRSRALPVAAADYWQGAPVRRYFANQVFRAVLVNRDRPGHTENPIAAMLEALDGGDSLVVFPEGTRGDASTPSPFKCGIYHLALQRPQVEIVPVWIDNAHRVLPKGAILPAPLLCSVTFGKPTRLLPDEDKRAFLTRLQQAVTALGYLCRPAHF